MTVSRQPELPDAAVGYVRGAVGHTDTAGGRRVLLGLCFVAMALLVVVLSVQAVQDNARAGRLQHHGVEVSAVVTGCLGVASGTGISESAYRCTAAFSLDGRRHTEAIRGSSALLSTGATIRLVVDPADPGSLSTVAAAQKRTAAAKAFIAPAITGLLLLLLAGVVAARTRAARPTLSGDDRRRMLRTR
jgi:Protein of unknown function (DUF3592)